MIDDHAIGLLAALLAFPGDTVDAVLICENPMSVVLPLRFMVSQSGATSFEVFVEVSSREVRTRSLGPQARDKMVHDIALPDEVCVLFSRQNLSREVSPLL